MQLTGTSSMTTDPGATIVLLLSPAVAFDETERKILASCSHKDDTPQLLHDFIVILACMGGYLARTGDPPPGNSVIWRGLSKLHDVRKGFELANVGN